MQGAEVSLSGNLGFVSLDEVLRLLIRSQQTGAVEVRGDGVEGRIFVAQRGVGLATTFDEATVQRHLIRSGQLETDQAEAIAAGTTDLTSAGDAGSLTPLLREMSVESVYRLGLHGETFEVLEGKTTPFASPEAFELEGLLADSEQRLAEWEEVRAIVSDLDREIRLQRDLGDRDEVTIGRDSWRVVSEVTPGVTITALADELGTTEFWTARVAAGLVEEGLLEIGSEVTAEATITAPVGEEVTEETAVPDAQDAALTTEPEVEAPEVEVAPPVDEDVAGEPAAEEADTEVEAPAAVAEADSDEPAEIVDPNESWWVEPETPGSDTTDELVEPVFSEATLAEPVWADETSREAEGHPVATDHLEEDTETFLEKVFSELEPEPEPDEGYGLLRRRRMGAMRNNVPE